MSKHKNKEKLSVFLKKRRNAVGLNQRELAEKLGYTSPQFISNWERGLARPPVFKLRDLAKLLNSSPDDLFQMLLEEVRTQLKNEFHRKPHS